MRLFTYTIPVDDGAAPNPWGGYCTLNICKPKIRSVANIGDWVMATGSKNVEYHGDLSNKCVYLMKVTNKIEMSVYDLWAEKYCPIKIVNLRDRNELKRRLGDSIYDFQGERPLLRPSVHSEENVDVDLGGKYTLISDEFLYFGDRPIDIPEVLLPVVLQGQGHRSTANDRYLERFIEWKTKLFAEFGSKQIHGKPQLDIMNINETEFTSKCSKVCGNRNIDNLNDDEKIC